MMKKNHTYNKTYSVVFRDIYDGIHNLFNLKS